jgi:orotate phosphoribosyltransferase
MEIAEKLKERGALMFGEFTLTSGKRSSYYVNIKKAYTDPSILREIAEGMAQFATGDRLAGVALGAIPIVVATSLRTGKPFAMIRKEDRQHGTAVKIEGEIAAGEVVDVLEDVTTTGGSVISAVAALRSAGGVVKRVIAVVDRGEGAAEALEREGVSLKSLVSHDDLRRMLSESTVENR